MKTLTLLLCLIPTIAFAQFKDQLPPIPKSKPVEQTEQNKMICSQDSKKHALQKIATQEGLENIFIGIEDDASNTTELWVSKDQTKWVIIRTAAKFDLTCMIYSGSIWMNN